MEIEQIDTEIDVTVTKKVVKTTVSLTPQDVESAIIRWWHSTRPDLLADDPVKIDCKPNISGYGDWDYEGHVLTIYTEIK
ncbi:hypothetical protein NKK48_01295 [Mesorhizobium sp. C386A]|uniref:hypothetical protein n=1 Tax=unclassified Mesorhizobium TaxID=325217 RepID=UPI0003CE2BAF|nr:hypothetical protein [Mesorhizobium sp. LNJC386A00]ESY35718.1 hypothetical protein X748_13965 [Mesorhizobium sp. LNJC386A00]